MNDTRTPEEKYAAWFNAVVICKMKGWKCVKNWEFQSPSGSIHDLSASDLNQLDRIEKEGISIIG